jgi:hypothetical protein
VLTLAESEHEEGADTYAGTRNFYRGNGFLDVLEPRPPGWVQTALLLVRPLAGAEAAPEPDAGAAAGS